MKLPGGKGINGNPFSMDVPDARNGALIYRRIFSGSFNSHIGCSADAVFSWTPSICYLFSVIWTVLFNVLHARIFKSPELLTCLVALLPDNLN